MKHRLDRRQFNLGGIAAGTAAGGAPHRPGRPGQDSLRLGGDTGLARPAGAGEKGHSQAFRPILRRRGDAVRRHPAGDHRAGVGRSRYRAAGLLFLRSRHPERAYGRSARHQRRDPGRRRRPRHQSIHGAQGRPGQNRGRPQGQGACHQRHRQCRRHRHAGGLPAQRVGGQPRLHHHRGPLPGHARDARREKGRPDQRGAAILARPRPQCHGA